MGSTINGKKGIVISLQSRILKQYTGWQTGDRRNLNEEYSIIVQKKAIYLVLN